VPAGAVSAATGWKITRSLPLIMQQPFARFEGFALVCHDGTQRDDGILEA
jgi:hypothetical protein